ncbi:hypothetical protein QBC34DRAFT_59290 [Podospora aff. communis PSN243]|uniref:Fungal N-terminal domain-containing protein n=1 Tax=Podospora aff. communis PSN243 TaxID=3040156 RepID=A0AAV9GTD1_9PEZI|nr:hypothetical protein QBC34DRAFT_59290 [Podospora aff. communis PSN243]
MRSKRSRLCWETMAKTSDQLSSTADLDPDGELWGSVKTLLDDIRMTLTRLADLLDGIESSAGSVLARGVLRRPVKQTRLKMKMKELVTFRDRVASCNAAMNSTLQMINLCMLIRNKASQDVVQAGLSDLKKQMGDVDAVMQVTRSAVETASSQAVTMIGVAASTTEGSTAQEQSMVEGVDMAMEGARVSQNLERFVRAVDKFHSNASTIISDGIRSTVWDGSMRGEPLSEEKYSKIENWIPPTIDEMPAAETSLETAQSDSDGEGERDFAHRLEQLALAKQRKGDAAGAEDFFRKAITRGESVRRPPQEVESMKLQLAYAYICQGKWEEAEVIVLPIAVEGKSKDLRAIHSLHALAIAHFELSDLDTAEEFAVRALAGKERLLGKAHRSTSDTRALLAAICDSRGERSLAEAHKSFIPGHHQAQAQSSPVSYILRCLAPTALPLRPAPAPSRRPRRVLQRPQRKPGEETFN